MAQKNKKYVLVDLDDKKSKKLAEAISNPTSRKILDYLATKEEASETEISQKLNLPLSTIHYNLQNLRKTGLIEVKKFSWSKKGKKIGYYRAAEKHIIISPRKQGFNIKILKTILPLFIGLIIIGIILQLPNQYNTQTNMQSFNSVDEIKEFIKNNQLSASDRKGAIEIFAPTSSKLLGATSMETSQADGASDYSTTNIQVQGVDEADIIKTDGKYIYTLSRNKLLIIESYPAEDMQILSEIELENTPRELFVNKNQLVLFSTSYNHPPPCFEKGCVIYPSETKTNINIYNIKDKSNPQIEKEITISGEYFSSRMIGDYVYTISNQHIYGETIIPSIRTDTQEREIEPQNIYYDNIKDYNFQNTIIIVINLNNLETNEKAILSGSTQNIYVSQNNIYTTFTKYPTFYEDITNKETTLIQKISIDKLEIIPQATGNVQGRILNQFSMDEFDENFRIATTTGNMWNSDEKSQNNLYVLDKNLQTIGTLEGLAPGERIYSVRFMGKRAYIVTFRKIDPLFVIDITQPTAPKVLGKLKIPGYSDYLHPYDENHIIGLGKDAIEAQEDDKEMRNIDFVWYQGIKIAIFDVSDVENPKELHKIIIGDRGTDSEALHNHKAFLFNKEKELLVLPITLAEIKEEITSDHQYGEQTFQGAFVYNLNLKDGFTEKGRITHYTDEDILKMGYYFCGDKNIRRSLYINNNLYTISDSLIKANNLNNLEEINHVQWKTSNSYPEPRTFN